MVADGEERRWQCQRRVERVCALAVALGFVNPLHMAAT